MFDGRLLFHPEQTGTGGFGIPAPAIPASLLQFGPGELGRLKLHLGNFRRLSELGRGG